MRSTLVVLALATASCQCGNGITIHTDGGGGSGGAGGSGGNSGGGTGGSGGGAASCNPACAAGQFCSATGHCLSTGMCGANADCQDGKVCDPATNTCVPGSSCGSTAVTGALVDPSIIVALDRSCSMKQKVGTLSKWQIAVSALNSLTTTLMGKAWFGLTLFPDKTGMDCTQDSIPIPISSTSVPAMQSLLNASLVTTDPLYPSGPCVTNIDTGVEQAATDPGLRDPTRKGYVLLLTDGEQSSCNAGNGNLGTQMAIADLHDAGVNTFVLAFGSQVDTVSLNKFADEGGMATGDPVTHFYKAEDQVSLNAALASIGSRTLGCTYKLGTVPPDPTRLFVFFDKTNQVLNDPTHAGGWDYDAARNEVTFYGQACDDLKNNRVTKLDIVYGCPVVGVN